MCDVLDKFICGEINRLIIEVPPQHGKSELVSKRLVAMSLGLNPDLKVVNAGYSHTHIARFNLETQRIIDSDEYGEVFPETTLKGTNQRYRGNFKRDMDIFEICGHKGYYKTVGIGGALTGSSMDLGIIDDPFKDYEEARSELMRERCWNWYSSVFRTRMHNDTKICMIMTRWHEDDLLGRVQARAESVTDEKWHIVTLRGIKEDDSFEFDKRKVGEPLWPEKFSLDFLKSQKQNDEKSFQSLYQQRPSSDTGAIFKRDDLSEKYLIPPDSSMFDNSCFSWDMAFKDHSTSDYVVGQAWAKKGATFFLLDEVRDIMDFTATLEAFEALCRKYPWIGAKLVEDKANGPAVISALQNKISGIIPINPEGGKVARANAVSHLFRAKNVKIPRHERAPWVDAYVEEMVSFPDGKYDDQVDATTQALRYLSESDTFYEVVW